jgi:hypothetical protein
MAMAAAAAVVVEAAAVEAIDLIAILNSPRISLPSKVFSGLRKGCPVSIGDGSASRWCEVVLPKVI